MRSDELSKYLPCVGESLGGRSECLVCFEAAPLASCSAVDTSLKVLYSGRMTAEAWPRVHQMGGDVVQRLPDADDEAENDRFIFEVTR